MYPRAARSRQEADRLLERAVHREVLRPSARPAGLGGMAAARTVGWVSEPRLVCVRQRGPAGHAPGGPVAAVASQIRLSTPQHAKPFIRRSELISKSAASAAAAPGVDPSVLLEGPTQIWSYYQATLGTNPIATKVRARFCTLLLAPHAWSHRGPAETDREARGEPLAAAGATQLGGEQRRENLTLILCFLDTGRDLRMRIFCGRFDRSVLRRTHRRHHRCSTRHTLRCGPVRLGCSG